jgi:hypothetical protein
MEKLIKQNNLLTLPPYRGSFFYIDSCNRAGLGTQGMKVDKEELKPMNI